MLNNSVVKIYEEMKMEDKSSLDDKSTYPVIALYMYFQVNIKKKITLIVNY